MGVWIDKVMVVGKAVWGKMGRGYIDELETGSGVVNLDGWMEGKCF